MLSDFVQPTLGLEVMIEFLRGERIPVNATVTIRSSNNKVLGVAYPVHLGEGRLDLDVVPMSKPTDWTAVRITVVLPLSPILIDHIEVARGTQPNGDAQFHCEIVGSCLVSKML
jgi:hypothetical protein